jgi:hypothetical protein
VRLSPKATRCITPLGVVRRSLKLGGAKPLAVQMEWETFVIIVASILAVVIILYLLWTGLGTAEIPRLQ